MIFFINKYFNQYISNAESVKFKLSKFNNFKLIINILFFIKK